MSRISSRVYKDDDYQSIFDLLARVRPSKFKHEYPTKADLEENLASKKTQARVRLWFDENRLIAWAYVDDFRNLRWEIESRYNHQVGNDVVEWGVACVRAMVSKNESSTLDASCREDYTDRIKFLEQYGFQRTENVTLHMQRDLLMPIPKPELPEGFAIRSVAGIEEAESIASLHRAAFGTDYMTTENRLAIMNASEYDPSLDLVVVAPNGTLAAYCTCSANLEDKIGSTDPVATHPDYQKLGLARALLLTGLSLLKDHDMQKATLGTSEDNIAMKKVAESVGFYIAYKTIWFEKRIMST